jgi:hypothetical protein
VQPERNRPVASHTSKDRWMPVMLKTVVISPSRLHFFQDPICSG